jgi:CBS domain-containing protein
MPPDPHELVLSTRPRRAVRPEGLTGPVADALLTNPKLSDANASVAEIRRLFLDDHVHMALLVDGERFVSAVEREDVHAGVPDDIPARMVGRLVGRTIDSRAPLREALAQMERTSRRRLAVVDERGGLRGLLCLKRRRNGFCSEADVLSRAESGEHLSWQRRS